MKLTTKSKRLVSIGLIVTAIMSVLAGLMVALSYPTAKHIDVAKQMNSAPDEKAFQALITSPETTWTMSVGGVWIVLQLILFVVAVILTYRYVRKNRLTPNAAGMTTGIVTAASVVAGLFTQLVDVLYGVSADYLGVWFLVTTTLMNLIISFIFAFIITLLVERRYNRKHSFEVE